MAGYVTRLLKSNLQQKVQKYGIQKSEQINSLQLHEILGSRNIIEFKTITIPRAS